MSKSLIDNDNAQAIFQGYANRIKAQQGKNLSKTITFKGTQYTTVEGILGALKEAVDPSPTVLTLGETYTFEGVSFICVEYSGDYYVIQTTGLSIGMWPGRVMTGPTGSTGTPWGNAYYDYNGNIDGENISGYSSSMSNLYDAIKDAEKTNASYGSGLYLVGISKTGTDSYSEATEAQKLYRNALSIAASNSSTNNKYAFLGTCPANRKAVYIMSSGYVDAGGTSQATDCAVAPAFNLDPLKVTVDANNVITLK